MESRRILIISRTSRNISSNNGNSGHVALETIMSQEDDVDVTPLSHNPFSYPQGMNLFSLLAYPLSSLSVHREKHKRSYLWAEKPMGSLNSDWFLQKIGQIWVESNNCKFYVCLTDRGNGDDTTFSITSYRVSQELSLAQSFECLVWNFETRHP